MKRRFILPLAAVALVGLMAAFATTALATPTKTSACTGCHSGAGATVTATLASTAGTNATYNFSAPGATAVAVFDGSTKLFTFLAASGQFTVATGKTYTVYAVTGPTTSDGVGSTTVSPAVVAPPTDTTAPVTTSDAKATYVTSAAIKLTATDAGSGVAGTYYILDGGLQVAGISVNVTALGAHTLEFWSVDVAGNVELHKTAAFTITAPVPVDTTAPVTVSDAAASYVTAATIKLSATDAGSGVAGTYYILDGAAQIAGTAINVTAVGAHTIEFWSVDVAGNVELHKTASFTVTAPVPVDTTAPVTVSDAKPTYVSSAAINFTATDAGSGVAGTYYALDGGLQVTGTNVSIASVGTHTVEFWSVDVAGNVEAHKTASFTITAAPPVPTTDLYTVTYHVSSEDTRGRLATLTNQVTGQTFTAAIGRDGSVTFTDVRAGTYTLSVVGNHSDDHALTVTVLAPNSHHHGSDDSENHHPRD